MSLCSVVAPLSTKTSEVQSAPLLVQGKPEQLAMLPENVSFLPLQTEVTRLVCATNVKKISDFEPAGFVFVQQNLGKLLIHKAEEVFAA